MTRFLPADCVISWQKHENAPSIHHCFRLMNRTHLSIQLTRSDFHYCRGLCGLERLERPCFDCVEQNALTTLSVDAQWHWYINTWWVGLTIGWNQLSCLFHLRPRSLFVKQNGFGSVCIELWGLLLSVPLVPLSLPPSVSFSLFLPLTNLRWSFRDLRSCPCWLQLQLNVWGIPRHHLASLGFKSPSSAANTVISSVFCDWKAELMCAARGNCYFLLLMYTFKTRL